MSRKHWYVWMSIFLSASLSVASCGTGSTQVSTVGMRSHYVSADSESAEAREVRNEQERIKAYLSALAAEQDRESQAQALVAAEKQQERVRAASAARPATRAVQASTAPSQVDWDAMARCESGGRWDLNSGNGFYGGLQFDASSWRGAGGTGLPHEHSREEQIARAEVWRSKHPKGMGAWPHCARQLGYYRG